MRIFFVFSECFFLHTPLLFMYVDSVGLPSHTQKTGDGGGSDEEKTADDNESR